MASFLFFLFERGSEFFRVLIVTASYSFVLDLTGRGAERVEIQRGGLDTDGRRRAACGFNECSSKGSLELFDGTRGRTGFATRHLLRGRVGAFYQNTMIMLANRLQKP